MKTCVLVMACGLTLTPLWGKEWIVNNGEGIRDFATIQECANSAHLAVGDTCLVYPGNYPEFVQVDKPNRVFKALHQAVQKGPLPSRRDPVEAPVSLRSTVEGFRIKHPNITVDGFDMTKFTVGLSPAHVTVEPKAHNAVITNNLIRDGVQMLSNQYFFDGGSKKITLSQGGFVEAGFRPGMKIYVGSNINNEIKNANFTRTIVHVTDTVLTVDPKETIHSEGPVMALLYATRSGRSGVSGISFTISSSDGGADNSLIAKNVLRNLAGNAVEITGSNHRVEGNLIERMNAWQIFSFIGHDNRIRFNHVRNSPRYPGFELPKSCEEGQTPGNGCAPDQSGGGHWDFVAQTFRSMGSQSVKGNDNIVEKNFIQNIDNQLFMISEKFPVFDPVLNRLVYVGQEAKRFIFRNNIIVGLEMHGAIHRPDSYIVNNLFYDSAKYSGTMFAVSTGYSPRDVGSAEGAVVSGNVFVGNGIRPDPGGARGWYHIENVNYFTADHNYVSGPAAENYSLKAEFPKIPGTEANGINGGDPLFLNINDPFGADGDLFTGDDGFKPGPNSRLCAAGPGGADIGVYSCHADKVFADTPAPGLHDGDNGGSGGESALREEPLSFLSFKNVFNPAGGEILKIRFNAKDDPRLIVVERGGKLVRALDPISKGEAHWDGRNIQGSLVASGTYNVILTERGKTLSTTVVVVK